MNSSRELYESSWNDAAFIAVFVLMLLTYTVIPDKEYGHRCNCQAWVTRERKFREGGFASTNPAPTCSHVAAICEWFSRRHQARKQANIKQAVLTMFG